MDEIPAFEPFKKIARLSRACVITEKIDGTNAQIYITDDGAVMAGSRSRWITPGKSTDNHGFAGWVAQHEEELKALGPGRHFGEWWGSGIQRGYGLKNGDKRFSLFNTGRWGAPDATLPACVGLVPVIYEGLFSTDVVESALGTLSGLGSLAAPGFMDPEGVVVFLAAARSLFKKTLKGDELPKSLAA